jgi:hypothetical protein
MRKITLLLSFVACAFFAQGQLLVNENFDYASGSALIGQGSWAIVGTSVINPINVSATSISYSGYPSSGIGQELSLANNGQDITKSFTAQKSGSIYFSVLVNLSAAQAPSDYFIHLGEPGSTSAYFGRIYAKLDAGKIAFGIANASISTSGVATYTTSIYELNTTYLIVVKVDVLTGTSSLIVNPAMSAEPTTDWIVSSTPTNGGVGGPTVPSAVGLGAINIRQGSSTNAPTLKLDGIRVATTWATLFDPTATVAAGTHNPSAANFNATVSGKNLLVSNVANGTTVEIFSALGSKVQSSELVNGAITLHNLTKGLYVVRVGKNTQKIRL